MSDNKTTPEPDDKVDEAVDETFPASDPPSLGGSTGPNDTKSGTSPKTD